MHFLAMHVDFFRATFPGRNVRTELDRHRELGMSPSRLIKHDRQSHEGINREYKWQGGLNPRAIYYFFLLEALQGSRVARS